MFNLNLFYFSIFKEVFLWARSNLELLLIALPEDIRNHLTTQQEYQATPLLKMKYPKKHIIGFGSFIILFCSVATQVRIFSFNLLIN